MFAASATVLGTSLALMVSYLVVKKKSRLSGLLDYVVVLPLTISGADPGGVAAGFVVRTPDDSLPDRPYIGR